MCINAYVEIRARRSATVNFPLKIDKISNNFDHSVVFQKTYSLSFSWALPHPPTVPFCHTPFTNQPRCEPVKLMKFRSQPLAISVRGFSGLEDLYQFCRMGWGCGTVSFSRSFPNSKRVKYTLLPPRFWPPYYSAKICLYR